MKQCHPKLQSIELKLDMQTNILNYNVASHSPKHMKLNTLVPLRNPKRSPIDYRYQQSMNYISELKQYRKYTQKNEFVDLQHIRSIRQFSIEHTPLRLQQQQYSQQHSISDDKKLIKQGRSVQINRRIQLPSIMKKQNKSSQMTISEFEQNYKLNCFNYSPSHCQDLLDFTDYVQNISHQKCKV